MRTHADDLRAEVEDIPGGDQLVAALMRDHREAQLDARDRAMLDFAVKLTLQQADMTRDDTDALRAQGFDDAAILHIVHVAALFNYYNRLADGLGVVREPEWPEPEWSAPAASS